jgi:hypothetical protein
METGIITTIITRTTHNRRCGFADRLADDAEVKAALWIFAQ